MPVLMTHGFFVSSGAATPPRPQAASGRAGAGPSTTHPRADMPPLARFSPAERSRLLLERGIGPTTIERLERAGYGSFEALRRAGVPRVVADIVEAVDSSCWKNRLRALERVLHAPLA